MKQMCLLLGVCINLIVLSSASADIWYVRGSLPSEGDGTSWQTAFKTIQPAIDAASAGDEVWVAQSVYDENRAGNGAIILKENISLYGGFAGTESNRENRDPQTYITYIDGSTAQAGNPAENNVEMAENTVLDGFVIVLATNNGILVTGVDTTVIRSCRIHSNGRGIIGNGLNVINCTIEYNYCEGSGGGILCTGNIMRIQDCLFKYNRSVYSGGAINGANLNDFQISNCVFMYNYSERGGSAINLHGIAEENGSNIITNCIFQRNIGYTTIDHDIIYLQDKSLVSSMISNCIFIENTFEDICCALSASDNYHCGMSAWSNEETEGEGEYQDGFCPLAPRISHCNFIYYTTIVSNYAVKSYEASALLTSCILYGCSTENCDITYSLSYPDVIPGNLNADPLFVDEENGDYRLRPESPCIDTGSCFSDEMDGDILGNPRPYDGDGLGAGTTGDGSDCDIGAYEYIGWPLSCLSDFKADLNGDGHINLSDLLRVIQLYNSDSFHCESGSEDGYALGAGDTSCCPHSSDYNPRDWQISLSELLRLVQFYNAAGYRYCPGEGSEDGFCPIVGAPIRWPVVKE